MNATLVIMLHVVVIVVLLGLCSGYDYPSCASCHAGMLDKKNSPYLLAKVARFLRSQRRRQAGILRCGSNECNYSAVEVVNILAV